LLYLDLETYSDLDLKLVSLDRYAAHPSTRILMCAYAFDDGPVELWAEGDSGLNELQERLAANTCVAWNVGFERTLIRRVWKLTGLTWRDAMVDALYAGLPAGLKDCNRVPFFANEAETTKETLLINKFCKPSKAGGPPRDRNTDPEDWAAFCDYCKRDVHDTRLILQWLLKRFEMPERVRRAWLLDQDINERGMPVDRLLTYRAWEEAQRLQAKAFEDLKQLTGLDNPNSPAQLLKWLQPRGYPYGGLGKELVKKALNENPEKGDRDLGLVDE
jgi:DNA polymerase